MRPLWVLGNWKMNGRAAMADALLDALKAGLGTVAGVKVGVAPPFPYLARVADRLQGTAISRGAQSVCAFEDGAYTGEVSAGMLADLGCTWVLIGHSERRSLFAETDAQVARKAQTALAAGLLPVICLGETRAEREAGQTEAVLARQLDAVIAVLQSAPDRCVLAYEPVWAIGTGLTATPEQAQAVHAFLRARMGAQGVATADQVPILYGGSMKPGNADALLAQPDVDGGLIGGASLSAPEFIAIVEAAVRSRA